MTADLRMRLAGGSIQHYQAGQTVSLDCQVEGHSEPPVSLYWERGNKVVTAKQRPGSVLETERLKQRSRVSLQFAKVELTDTGEFAIQDGTHLFGIIRKFLGGN